MRIILTFIFCLLGASLVAQTNRANAFKLVLEGDEIGKEYVFGGKTKSGFDSLILVYLGEITTEKQSTIKFLSSRWYWGLSPRATSRVIVFNQKNQYLGDYYMTMNFDLPKRIEDDALIFQGNSENSCDRTSMTKVSFKNGIPNRFFVKCKGDAGNFYSFNQNL
jgi:hypothetical protein